MPPLSLVSPRPLLTSARPSFPKVLSLSRPRSPVLAFLFPRLVRSSLPPFSQCPVQDGKASHTQAHTRARTHTHTHTHAHAGTHTHTLTHTQQCKGGQQTPDLTGGRFMRCARAPTKARARYGPTVGRADEQGGHARAGPCEAPNGLRQAWFRRAFRARRPSEISYLVASLEKEVKGRRVRASSQAPPPNTSSRSRRRRSFARPHRRVTSLAATPFPSQAAQAAANHQAAAHHKDHAVYWVRAARARALSLTRTHARSLTRALAHIETHSQSCLLCGQD